MLIQVFPSNSTAEIKALRKQARRRTKQICEEQKGICAFCNKPMTVNLIGVNSKSKKKPTIDHIINVCEGGRNERENLRVVCYGCNQKLCQDKIAHLKTDKSTCLRCGVEKRGRKRYCPQCKLEISLKIYKNSIPKVSNEYLVKHWYRIKPLVLSYGHNPGNWLLDLYKIKDYAGIDEPYSWNYDITGKPGRLKAIKTIRTLHRYGSPNTFQPTIAEVIAQIPPELIGSVDYFVVNGPETAEDMNREKLALDEGFHVAETTLYKKDGLWARFKAYWSNKGEQ